LHLRNAERQKNHGAERHQQGFQFQHFSLTPPNGFLEVSSTGFRACHCITYHRAYAAFI
jgi:hypothetical protein